MHVTRRSLLATGLAAAPLLAIPGLAIARAETDRRFVMIVLRGAMDGLNVVAPVGDVAYAPARGALALQQPATIAGLFALHPALFETTKMYAANEALFVHAAASPYRDRSHFDGQNVLETGGTRPYERADGWLNRLLPLLPGGMRAVAIAPAVPPVLRGRVGVASYAPSGLGEPTDDLLERVGTMYAPDPQLHPVWDEAMAARRVAQASGEDAKGGRDLPRLAKLAADFLIKPDGARIAVLEHDGWDTHSGEQGRLANQLRQLDAALAALKTGLGPEWQNTVVLCATEFGRTVAANGTGGTDHGTASVAILAGGAVQGGKVISDWPGLAPGALYEARDLKPTTDLRSVLLAASAVHLGVDPARATRALFPDAPALRATEGLVRA
jgi:uncharacterized protein (DUF1501 family)